MKNIRKMSKLLAILKTGVKKDKGFLGMCITLWEVDMNSSEDIKVRRYLRVNAVAEKYHWEDTSYWWKSGVKAPRLRWLDKHIGMLLADES